MELKVNNNSFVMSLVGYQFPELEDVEYDSNWLNVKIALSHQRGKWSTIDPALLTYEVQWLIDWLKAVSARKYDNRQVSFMEPCLSFHLSPAEGCAASDTLMRPGDLNRRFDGIFSYLGRLVCGTAGS